MKWTPKSEAKLIEWRKLGLDWDIIGERLRRNPRNCGEHYRRLVKPRPKPKPVSQVVPISRGGGPIDGQISNANIRMRLSHQDPDHRTWFFDESNGTYWRTLRAA